MTMRECYARMGGDYEDTMRRLRCEERAGRYLVRFLSDPTAGLLWRALEAGQGEAAFIAAHTLKGVSSYLGMNRLYASCCALTDALRAHAAGSVGLGMQVRIDYEEAVHAVEGLGLPSACLR